MPRYSSDGDDVTPDRAFILGFDGVPWDLIQKWTAAAELPNFSKLLEEGAGGPLESTTPASTPLAWPSIATGTWADKHGIYGFQKLDSNYTHRMYTNENLERPAIWEMVSPAVVGNVPMTYPAKEIDGKLVSGIMAPDLNSHYTHPSTLVEDIQEQIPEYMISLKWGDYVGNESQLVEDIAAMTEMRRNLMRMLMDTDDWRTFFFTFMGPDRLQHLVWDEEILLEHYKQIDDILGEVLDYVAKREANLFVVSDHGFGPIKKNVCVNHVLRANGFLHKKEQVRTRGLLGRVGINKNRLQSLLDTIGIDETKLVDALPRSIVDTAMSQIPGEHVLYDIDPERTRAFVHEAGNLYINDTRRFDDGIVEPAEIDEVKRELTSLFVDLTDPETGERVLHVRDGDIVFADDPDSPDLVLEPRESYEVSTALSSSTFRTPAANASHRKDGIFFAWGQDIEPGADVADATVVDVVPTILHSIDEPTPQVTDGRVLQQVFRANSSPARRTIRTREYLPSGERAEIETDFEDVKDRLKGLGYMEQ